LVPLLSLVTDITKITMAMLDKVEAPEFKLYPSTERDNRAPRDDISRRDLLPNR
jgi:hypothetical protein